uniref:Uncharacterized protein n=1 Tax=viral metagenome TaxID=1070528 RepID=A0A6C0CMM7_9ZZZZ
MDTYFADFFAKLTAPTRTRVDRVTTHTHTHTHVMCASFLNPEKIEYVCVVCGESF